MNAATQPAAANPLTLNNVLTPQRIVFIDDSTKEDALRNMAEVLSSDSRVKNRDELLTAIYKREELMSTGIGLGIGVPHVRIDSVEDIVMAVGITASPITDYESLDDEPIRIICMIAARSDQHAKHIKLLSAVSKLLKNTEMREQILSSKSEQDVFDIFTGKSDA
jgi:PTS system nitrogen regulatory IIA component